MGYAPFIMHTHTLTQSHLHNKPVTVCSLLSHVLYVRAVADRQPNVCSAARRAPCLRAWHSRSLHPTPDRKRPATSASGASDTRADAANRDATPPNRAQRAPRRGARGEGNAPSAASRGCVSVHRWVIVVCGCCCCWASVCECDDDGTLSTAECL